MPDDVRILIISSEREGRAGRISRRDRFAFHFSPFGYEDFIGYKSNNESDLVVYRATADRVARLADEGYRAVWCESPEALLIQSIRYELGLPRIPFIINEEDRLVRVSRLAEWMERRTGNDPLPAFLRREENFWFHMTRSQRPFYLDRGVPPDRLYYLACSTGLLHYVAPEQLTMLRAAREENAPPVETAGNILAAGTNNRDFKTLAAAAESLPEPVHIITDLRRHAPMKSRNTVWHDFMPVGDYLRALRQAKFVVTPLRNTTLSGGEMTPTYAMALGRAVIASRVEATEDFITHEKDGLLVPPEDPDALAGAMLRLIRDPREAERLADEGRKTEDELRKTCEANTLEVFERAAAWVLKK